MAIAGFALVVLIRSIHAKVLLANLMTISESGLGLAALLLIPNIGVQWLKWHYLLTRVNPALPPSLSFKSLMVGFPLGMATPGRLGEVGRGLVIDSIPKQLTLTLAVIDKIISLLITIVFGLLAMLFSSFSFYLPRAHWILVAIAIIGIGLALGAVRITAIKTALQQTGLRCKNYWFVCACAAIFYFVFVAQLLTLSFSFVPLNPVEGLSAAAATFFVKSVLPISLGDLGIREGAAVFFFTKIGVSAAAAFNASVLLFMINVVIPTAIGFFYLFEQKDSQKGQT